MSNTDNHWTFTGQMVEVKTKTTKNDKQMHTVVLEQQDGKYKWLGVFTFWKSLPSNMTAGDMVHAEGSIDGREWQEKFYAGLTASKLEVVGNAAQKKPDLPPPAEPDGKKTDVDDGCPF